MKGKSSSKREHYGEKQRTRFTLKDKRQIIAIRTLGHSKETIEVKMNKKSNEVYGSKFGRSEKKSKKQTTI